MKQVTNICDFKVQAKEWKYVSAIGHQRKK